MHRHITFYTQSTVCVGGFTNIFLSSSSWAYAGFARGPIIIWGGGGDCDAWHSHDFATGLPGPGACFLEKNNLLMVQFGAYFHNFFTFKKSKNSIFIQK